MGRNGKKPINNLVLKENFEWSKHRYSYERKIVIAMDKINANASNGILSHSQCYFPIPTIPKVVILTIHTISNDFIASIWPYKTWKLFKSHFLLFLYTINNHLHNKFWPF